MKLKEIVWKSGKYGFKYGYVGKISLFSFGYDSMKSKGTETETPYKLGTTLPGFSRQKFMCKSQDHCKERAKRILDKFLEEICEKEEEV